MRRIKISDKPITVQCIDNEDMEEHLVEEAYYEAYECTDAMGTDKFLVKIPSAKGDYELSCYRHRFKVVNEEDWEGLINKDTTQLQSGSNNKTYWYYTYECYDKGKLSNAFNSIIDSDNNMFPLRKAEENAGSKGSEHIEYKMVIQISKEDYEWKLAEMSKFGGND